MSIEDDEKDLNRMAIQAQILQRQGSTLSGQIDVMQTTLSDLQATIDTLDQLAKAKEVGLLPIGSGTYITCKGVDADQVLISVGSGIIVGKKAPEAAELLRKRYKSVSEAFDVAQKNLATLNTQLQDLNAKASVLAARIEDVRPSER